MLPFENPIKSFGIILITRKGGEIQFLLYKRRDTYSYLDFMRGRYNTQDDLEFLFQHMSALERTRIRNYTFDELWDDLWVTSTCHIAHHERRRSSIKFNTYKEIFPKIMRTTHSFCNDASWGFPKGKKNRNESSKDCALREFYEETRISRTHVNESHILNFNPLRELFRGTDGKMYETLYYIAYTDDFNIIPEKIYLKDRIRTQTISDEASDLNWFTHRKTEEMLSYSEQRKHLIGEVLKRISNDVYFWHTPRRR